MQPNPYVTSRQPHGFKPHASGLLVPEPISREREVWTRDEYKTINRALKLLASRKVEVFLGCPQCKAAPIEKIKRNDGGLTLRCAHKDREFQASS